MASKTQLQDSVLERRLRPIYDYLDAANNKKALQECDKVLKKTPHLQCGKALKSLSLLRLGRDAECNALLESLAAERPSDESTIVAMTICYRELQQYVKACEIYEGAVRADPTNEEAHTQLFMSYVRVADFKAQQHSAMTLYKQSGKSPYYCWAVMSVVLQATRVDDKRDKQDETKRKLLLSLAERMLRKLDKLEAEQEVQLLVLVLQLLGKHEEELNVLDSDLGSRVSGDVSLNRLRPLRLLGRWRDVNVTCKAILTVNSDNWSVWKRYLDSVFQLSNNTGGDVKEDNSVAVTNGDNTTSCDYNPQLAVKFINQVIEENNTRENSYVLRGPYLARFELCRHLVETNQHSLITPLVCDSILQLFLSYFRIFGHRQCCVADLRGYLGDLMPVNINTTSNNVTVSNNDSSVTTTSTTSKSSNDNCVTTTTSNNDSSLRHQLAEGVITSILPKTAVVDSPDDVSRYLTSERHVLRHIHALQLARLCGVHHDVDRQQETLFLRQLQACGIYARSNYGNGLLPLTDQHPADGYTLLMCHILAERSRRHSDSGPLLTALALLQELLAQSPSNFHAKLLAVRYYHMLGGGLGAAEMYDSLDIKHLQLDSLGYIHCARLPTTGLLTTASALYDHTLKFFINNCKDSMDHLTFLYKYGSFLKLDEFMDFRERMNNSLHFAMTVVERHVLSILLHCNTVDTLYTQQAAMLDDHVLNNRNYQLLRDNHDLDVYQSYEPSRVDDITATTAHVTQLFNDDVTLLRLRHDTLSSLSGVVALVKALSSRQQQPDNTTTTAAAALTQLTDVMQRLQSHIVAAAAAAETIASSKRYYPVLPYNSRLETHHLLNYPALVLDLLTLVVQTHHGNTNDAIMTATVDSLSTRLRHVVDAVRATVVEQNITIDYLQQSRVAMETVSVAVEMLSMAALFAVLVHEQLSLMLSSPQQQSMTVVTTAATRVTNTSKQTTNASKQRRNKTGGGEGCVAGRLSAAVKMALGEVEVSLSGWKCRHGDDTTVSVHGELIDRLARLELELTMTATAMAVILRHLDNSHTTAVKELRNVLRAKVKMLAGYV